MLQFSSLIVFYIVGVIFQFTQAKIQVTISNVTAVSNPDYVKLKVNVKNSPSGLLVDIDSELLRDVSNGLQLWVEIQAKNDVSGYETLFKSDNLDLCSMFETVKEHPLATPFIDKIKEHGNIPQSCPVPKGHYLLKEFFIDGQLFPSFIPSGKFRIKYGIANPVSADKVDKLFDMEWDIEVMNDSAGDMPFKK